MNKERKLIMCISIILLVVVLASLLIVCLTNCNEYSILRIDTFIIPFVILLGYAYYTSQKPVDSLEFPKRTLTMQTSFRILMYLAGLVFSGLLTLLLYPNDPNVLGPDYQVAFQSCAITGIGTAITSFINEIQKDSKNNKPSQYGIPAFSEMHFMLWKSSCIGSGLSLIGLFLKETKDPKEMLLIIAMLVLWLIIWGIIIIVRLALKKKKGKHYGDKKIDEAIEEMEAASDLLSALL